MMKRYVLSVAMALCVIGDFIPGFGSSRVMAVIPKQGISDTSVTARKTGHFGSLLLSMRCAFCRRQGNQPCIDRVCSLISESH
ncbi:uncharacterized protein LOC124137686 isoform X2 [Haliotis rufescens]|uniref:uncharacterized protein LOC124137686 isoform X2 n=1 Tax=Haliotis rufescens TaxID=6454 RepID=UPI001EB0723F|nr:uncharacterized protein LOC124137686 isoform X2 [Haliotis rufescens]XP_048247597.1 uncharacterized protein LOC124137686 isoform X2 [Haliotis rufescens]